ncbi:hypothetical protein [Leucobacter massiliensis]|uniref:DUF1918 domain-containing protein n=1 Tax=Leucobacter massiliensis TaxID=1686285 RepID=A0A2S9QQN8_9MICO|nr:hypothetical protein [Leucobacter massiliensis]PRI11909.1 hypothetical protein B4915_02195 [Leucobacter massiliensis]
MTLQEIHVGDVVRVDDDPKPYRVDGRTRDGILTLESLHAYPRVVWDGVYEFRVTKSRTFQ